MSPLKILQVIAGGERGGAETFCLDTVLALNETGVKQHVIGRPHPHFVEALSKASIPFTPFSFSHLDKLGNGRSTVKTIITACKPDVVHAWMGRAASFIPKSVEVPVLGWFGGYYDLKRYRTCDFFMGVTKDIVRHIVDKTGKPNRTFLVHTFGTLQDEPAVDRASLYTPTDAPVVLLLSRMHWKKGVDTLLKAAEQLPGVYFWLAGDGPQRSEYEILTRSLGIGDRVRFLGWRTDRAALLKTVNVCVLPSRYEPFGTVIAESWHMKVPLVATKADGARQYVEDGNNGLLCGIDDAHELANQIRRILSSDELGTILVKNGLTAYEKMFSKKVVVDSLINSYRSITRIGKKIHSVPVDVVTKQESDAALVAAIHELENEDTKGDWAGVSLDVADLQNRKLHNFLHKRGIGRATECEIWSPAECDLALENFKYLPIGQGI